MLARVVACAALLMLPGPAFAIADREHCWSGNTWHLCWVCYRGPYGWRPNGMTIESYACSKAEKRR